MFFQANNSTMATSKKEKKKRHGYGGIAVYAHTVHEQYSDRWLVSPLFRSPPYAIALPLWMFPGKLPRRAGQS